MFNLLWVEDSLLSLGILNNHCLPLATTHLVGDNRESELWMEDLSKTLKAHHWLSLVSIGCSLKLLIEFLLIIDKNSCWEGLDLCRLACTSQQMLLCNVMSFCNYVAQNDITCITLLSFKVIQNSYGFFKQKHLLN